MQRYKSPAKEILADHETEACMVDTPLTPEELGHRVYWGLGEIAVGMVGADDADELGFDRISEALKSLQVLSKCWCDEA